jgi:hypothetical protein
VALVIVLAIPAVIALFVSVSLPALVLLSASAVNVCKFFSTQLTHGDLRFLSGEGIAQAEDA